MSRTTRTFLALPLPNLVKVRLERLQQLVAPSLPDASWEPREMFHLTVAFLGDVADTDLNGLCKGVASAVADLPRFSLTIKGFGAFPDAERPRVVWAGVEGDLAALEALQKACCAAAVSAGYRPDERFQPHVTLGRVKIRKGETLDVSKLVAHYRTWAAGVAKIDSVTTFQSTFTPEGPAYAPLNVAPLKPPDRA